MDNASRALPSVRTMKNEGDRVLARLHVPRHQENLPVRKGRMLLRKPMDQRPKLPVRHDRRFTACERASRQQLQGGNTDHAALISSVNEEFNSAGIDSILGMLVGVHCVFFGGSLVREKILTEEWSCWYIKRHVPGSPVKTTWSRWKAPMFSQRRSAAACITSCASSKLRACSVEYWWMSHPCSQASSVLFATASSQSEAACGLDRKGRPRPNACHPSSFAFITLRVIWEVQDLARPGRSARDLSILYPGEPGVNHEEREP
jgi:hypothetical protein